VIPAAWVHRAWATASWPAWRRFRAALADPVSVQSTRLRRILERNAGSAYGRLHSFDRIDGTTAFRRIPLTTWADYEPYVERIRRGERGVLTAEPVRRLVPTGGSAGGRKLVPWTRSLGSEFQEAIGAWIFHLFRRHPEAARGRAYWSVSPSLRFDEPAAVPIGFDGDTAYLGRILGPLVCRAFAVPESVARIASADALLHETILHLVRARDLSLISIWHPSFLTLLLDRLAESHERVSRDLARWNLRLDSLEPRDLWPRLAVVSAWGSAHAEGALEALAQRLPGVAIEPKGLLATEGFVSLPFEDRWPAAVTAHFLEFLDEAGRTHLAHELRDGAEYSVVLTTSGGLYRYCLGDRVRVEGFLGRVASLRFLGRENAVSDRVGEKLTDAQVAGALRQIFGEPNCTPSFAMLAPDGPGYTLFVEADSLPPELAARLDEALRVNPHYAWARDVGQIGPISVLRVNRGAQAIYLDAEQRRGRRLGEVKGVALSDQDGWREILETTASRCHRARRCACE
jgi:hypothetical protein